MKLHLPVRLLAFVLSFSSLSAEIILDSKEILTSDAFYQLTDDTTYFEGAYISGSNFRYHVKFDGGGEHSLIFDLNEKLSEALIKDTKTLKFENLALLEVKNTRQQLPPHDGQSATTLFKSANELHCVNIGQIYLHDNHYIQEASFFFTRSGTNGATPMMLFSNINEIRMENNHMGHYIGAHSALGGFFVQCDGGDLLIENVGNFVLSNNSIHNESWGGMILVYEGKSDWNNVGNILFQNNEMSSPNTSPFGNFMMGGAIWSADSLTFTNCGNIVFEENKLIYTADEDSTLYGGAIAIGFNANPEKALFSADYGDIVFKGNQIVDQGAVELDSIFMAEVGNFIARARTGQEVVFFDKLTADVQNIQFNKNDDTLPDVKFDGSIRFSGEYLDHYIVQGRELSGESDEDFISRRWRSRYSYLGANVLIDQGRFTVEKEAAIGIAPESWTASKTTWQNLDDLVGDKELITFSKDTSFTVGNIPFYITTQGMVMGKEISVKNTQSVFRTDGSGVLIADKVDFSRGVSYDFDFSLTQQVRLGQMSNPYLSSHSDAPSGVIISSKTLTLGGNFMVADSARTYTNSFWGENREFLVLKDVNQSRGDSDFDAILSTVTQSNEVRDPHQYQGDWSMRWDNNDLYAVWSKTGDIIEPTPEDVSTGSLVESTLWITMSNMKALSNVTAQQIDSQRYQEKNCRHIWVSALGDFLNQDTNGSTNGFTYHGYGVAVGADSFRCKKFVGGISLGYMNGKMNTRLDSATADLDSLMATAYAGYRNKIDDKSEISWLTSLSGINTSTKSHTVFNSGEQVFGKWDNTGIMIESKFTWNYQVSDSSFISPHVGIEYVYEQRDAFDETGNMDRARHFEKTNLKNLRLPVGLAWRNEKRYSEQKIWFNTFDGSLLFDVSRSNPEGVANALINDFRYNVSAANPAREAVRLSWSSYYRWNDHWGVFGGYNTELRKNAIYQQGNIGLSYTF